jgi:hypothetical protein
MYIYIYIHIYTGKNRGETALTGAARMGEKLIEAVQTLQQTILDVHFLFFKPAEVSVLNNTTTVVGLILVHQLEFIRDIERALLPLLPTAGIYIYVYVYIYMYTYMYVYVYKYMYMIYIHYIFEYTYLYIYTYLYFLMYFIFIYR